MYSHCCLCILIFRPRILIVVSVFLLLSMYSYCQSMYSHCCLCILIFRPRILIVVSVLIVVYVFLLLPMYSYCQSMYSHCCLCILIFRPRILIVVSVFLLLSMYSYCQSMYSHCCLCILIFRPRILNVVSILIVHVFLDAATLTEVFPCFFLGCKANARVILAKRGTARTLPQLLCCCMYCCFYCSVYCLCVNVYCHRVTTQLQLTNISYHIIYHIPEERSLSTMKVFLLCGL